MSRPHEPKLAALAAYHAGLLSPRGKQRLDRHLAGCAACAEALRGLARYATLLPAAQRGPEPNLDWARIERSLERELLTRARRKTLALTGLALAAAAVVGLVLAWPTEPREPRATVPELPAPPPAELPPPMLARVLAHAGAASVRDEHGQPVALSLDTQPRTGWVLTTGADGELHLGLQDTASVILPASSELRLAELHAGSARLDLLAGRVVSQVERRNVDERYEVIALGYTVRVRGTHFEVAREGEGLRVDVAEGTVTVLGADGAELAELVAPRHWDTAAGVGTEASRSQLRIARPLRAQEGALAPVELPTAPRVVAWDFLGADLSAAASLQMRAPPGEYEIGALLEDGRRMTATLRVDPLGTRFDPRGLRFHGAPGTAAHEATGTLDPATARTVIRDAQPALQRCYERSLRNEPASSLRVRMRVSLDPRGRVRRIELSSDETSLPAPFAACIEQVALRLQFDPPGGDGVVFDAPLAFQPVP